MNEREVVEYFHVALETHKFTVNWGADISHVVSFDSLLFKRIVPQTALVRVINQKRFDVLKFVICETKWRQQADDNRRSHGGRRNNSGRKQFFF